MRSQPEVTRLLVAYSGGDREAMGQLMPILYDQLKKLAHARLRDERSDHTLNTTGLVHEAYLKLVDVNRVDWKSRIHFLAMASKLMRRILINYARDRNVIKRGGGQPKQELDEQHLIPDSYAETLLELEDSLKQLEALYPRQGEAVLHRYFGGLTNEEAAEVLGVSLTTVERDLRFARAWLAREWGVDMDR